MISGVVHGVIRPPVRSTLSKGGGVIFDFTVIALGRVIGPNTRFIDTRSA